MKHYLWIILSGLLFCSCEPNTPQLRLFTWSSYFDPATIRQFEHEYNCRVLFDLFDSNELMYAKLKSSKEGYDIVTPSLYLARLMIQQQMLQPLELSKLPNLRFIDPIYGGPEEYTPYCAPYLVSMTGVGYIKSILEPTSSSWKLFCEPRLRWRTTLLNDYRETLAAGLLYLGYDPNFCTPQQLERALGVLMHWKPLIAKFENEQYKLGLDSGEFLVVQGYSGDIAQVMLENPKVGFFLPKEGFTYSVDVLCIHKASQQSELAHAFINFMHRPEIAAQNTVHTCYLCPNSASYPLIPEPWRSNPAIFVSPEQMERGHLLVDVGKERNQLFLQAWDRLRSF